MPEQILVSTSLAWYQILAFVSLPSAFGGFLQGLYAHYISDASKIDSNPNDSKKINVRVRLTIAALMGVGGGAAATLASIWLKKFEYAATDENILYIIVLSVVAGFIGHRILPTVAKSMEEKLNLIEHRVEKVQVVATEAKEQSTGALAQATTAKKSDSPADEEKTLEDLLRLRKESPLNRGVNMSLVHELKRLGRLDDSIKYASEFITLKQSTGVNDVDLGDMLYNRACYKILKASKGNNGELIGSGLDDLSRAVELNPDNRNAAKVDGDFDLLRQQKNRRYIEITGYNRQIPEN